jgi:fatty-acyl-CoA synthase
MNLSLTPVRFLRRAMTEYPNKVGIVDGEQRFTYGEFGRRCGQLGSLLRELDVQPGDRVAFLGLNSHHLLEAYYGVLEAGVVLLPLNVRLAPPELSFILNDASATVLFYDSELKPLLEAFRKDLTTVKRIFSLEEYDGLLAQREPYYIDWTTIDENSLAELFYTSGTTSNPKGVMLTHRNLYLHGFSVLAGIGDKVTAVELHTIPLFHANGWGRVQTLTCMGGTHVLMRRFDPAQVLALVAKERVEAFAMVPTMAIALLNCAALQAAPDLSSLKYVSIGGAASSPELVAQLEKGLGCACYSGYGLTETSPVMSMSLLKPSLVDPEEYRYTRQSMAGCAFPCVEIRVVDQDMNDVPCDSQSVGEVVTRGDNVMAGYWRQPESTAEAFRGGWFHTGDLAVMDKDRYLLIVDRKKEIIVSGGENISSLEVEKALLAHPAVYECAVIPVPDDRWGEVPKALVSLKPGQSASEAEMIEFVRGRLAHYKVPKTIEFLAELPKSGTGKILKRVLREKYWEHLTRRVGT